MTEEKFPIDKSTIRSNEQYQATIRAARHGCPWCMPEEEQDSPTLFTVNDLVVVRRNVFPKKGRDMYIIHVKRHASLKEITPKETHALFLARQRLIEEYNLPGGGIIHRFGAKKYHASSLPTDHYFENIVVPHGDQPVAETLCKDISPEKVVEREERAATFVDPACDIKD